MSERPKVSIIIVSLARREYLHRVLRSLSDLTYRPFEVITVADINPIDAFPDLPNVENIRHIPCDIANISAARNRGIKAAAGEIVAFCDDDAVPEPTWLDHLIAPFDDAKVGAAGGFVIGRNGISFQWTASTFDCTGQRTNLSMPSNDPVILQGDALRGIKTEGTNCAFRREVLFDLNGFDEGFTFYLDETDLNYRLGLAGWKTALVPLARVHHGYAQNRSRRANRAPSDLTEIGASMALFCQKHSNPEKTDTAKVEFRADQKRRLVEHMIAGRLDPFEISPLMTSLEKGLAQKGKRGGKTQARLVAEEVTFRPFTKTQPPKHIGVHVRRINRRKVQALLEKVDLTRLNITIFCFSLTGMFHRMTYSLPGIWVQSGGIFGRSDRKRSMFRISTLRTRATDEAARLAPVRPLVSVKSLSRFLKELSETP